MPEHMTRPRIYELRITGWLPVTVNRLLGTHPMGRSKLKRAGALEVKVAALLAGIPNARGKRRLHATFVSRQPGDPDNRLKALLDALVKARLLVDDSAQWCELGRIRCECGRTPTTILTLEELADEPEGGTP